MTLPYALSSNPMRTIRNVSTYALWPTRYVPGRGYDYLWGCGHEGPLPHRCPKGPNRNTLFEAPDLRTMRPAWGLASKFMARHGVTPEWGAEEARRLAVRRVA